MTQAARHPLFDHSAEHGFTSSWRSAEHGFTLIEMLVALVIFALLAGASVGLLRASVTTQSAVENRLAELRSLERLRILLATDLGQALDRPTRAAGGAIVPAFAGSANGFTVVRGGWSNLDGARRGTLQRARYDVAGGALTRGGYASLDGAPEAPPEATRAELARGLASASFRFRAADGGWRELWSSDSERALPTAVELTLQRTGELPLRLLFAIPPGKRPEPAEPPAQVPT